MDKDTHSLRYIRIALAIGILSAVAFVLACNDNGDSAEPDGTPSASEVAGTPTSPPGTPARPDPDLARSVFNDFVTAVQAEDIEAAWALYAASVPGDTSLHSASLGCDFNGFNAEFAKMKHMFDRLAPFTVDEVFGTASGSIQIELKLTAQDGDGYLATLVREPPGADYRMISFNNGRAALQPGVPDPFPSPEDPRGFCKIWTGPR